MTRAYKVSEIGGSPIITEALERKGSSIQRLEFNGDRFKIIGSGEHRDYIINADIARAEVFFNLDDPYITGTKYIFPNELFFNLRISVPFYTIQTEDTPVEMTLDEIEKKLGHKVSIVNKEGDS